jgi:O-methyltransferase involved in polyketide biosynthesis
LKQAGLVVPENVTFLTMNLEAETLAESLKRGNVEPSMPTFFSWLGVTVYLTETAIDAVFSGVAEYPSGSEIVFTFAQPRGGEEDVGVREGSARLAEQSAAVGEPWRSYFTIEALQSKLRAFGFRQVEFLTPSEAETQYFVGRSDGLPVPRRTSIGCAIR